MKKSNILLSAIALAASSALLLSGCASKTDEAGVSLEVIPLSENVNVSKFPSWADTSMALLQNDGWAVTKAEPNGAQKENKDWPNLYTAVNKDQTCTFTLGIEPQYPNITGNGEEFETRAYMYNITKNLNAELGEETTQNVNINDKNKSLELMKVGYTYPNKTFVSTDILITEGSTAAPAPLAEGKVDGKVNGLFASRVLSAEIANPFYMPNPTIDNMDAKAAPPDYIGKTVRPVINVKYECVNKDLDIVLWDKVTAAATLKMDIIANKK